MASAPRRPLPGEHQTAALPQPSAATTFSWGCRRRPLPHRELGRWGQGASLNLPHFLLNWRVPRRTLGGDVSTNAGRGLVQKGGARAGAQGRTESSLRRPRGPCSTKDLWGSENGRGSGPRPCGRTRGPGVWASPSWGPCSPLLAFPPCLPSVPRTCETQGFPRQMLHTGLEAEVLQLTLLSGSL